MWITADDYRNLWMEEVRRRKQVETDLRYAKEMCERLAARIAAQTDLLARRAERAALAVPSKN